MKKTIIAICDSEGAPHRGDGHSSLWNFCVVMKYIVNSDTFETLQECHHTFQFSMPKYLTRNVVKSSLMIHFEAINYIRCHYNCNDICFCFWNSPHDLSVLNYYDFGHISTIDLLVVAKKQTNNKYESYNIGKLCKALNIKTNVKIHTALGDVIRLIELLPKLYIDDTTLLKPYVKNKDKTLCEMMGKLNLGSVEKKDSYIKQKNKPQIKHEEKSGRTRRGSDEELATSKSSRRTHAIHRAKNKHTRV